MSPKFIEQFFKSQGLPAPTLEFKFHPTRKWRFDYAWPALKIALEVEGGIWTGGRHTRGAGFKKDMEKYNAAAVMGWRIIRCEPKELLAKVTIENLRETMKP
jgi:very-short-patch-repair endonuclease